MTSLHELPNIGKVLEEDLIAVNITSLDDLEAIGSEEAWLRIRAIDPTACLHKLLALEGAIQQIPKAQLSKEDKERLLVFFRTYQNN